MPSEFYRKGFALMLKLFQKQRISVGSGGYGRWNSWFSIEMPLLLAGGSFVAKFDLADSNLPYFSENRILMKGIWQELPKMIQLV